MKTEQFTTGSVDAFSTKDQVIRYYTKAPGYLEGPLNGSCHFGDTEEDEPFELETALRSMEMKLGQALGLEPGSKVLDAGCGYGRVATTLCQKFGLDIVGIDLIQERLIEASRYTTDRNISKDVGLIRGSYCELPIADSSFSGVYTMETLVHADPLESALSEFLRVLEPGGKLVLFEYSVPEREKLDPIRRRITDTMVHRTGMTSIGRFTHGSFPDLLEEAGFENVTVEDISRNVWPTWRWLFIRAIRGNWRKLPWTILSGKLMEKPNLAGSLFIWPYRHQLGYNVVTATKPDVSL